MKDNNQPSGGLIVDNAGLIADLPTPLMSSIDIFDRIEVRNNAVLELQNEVFIESELKLEPNGSIQR